MSTTDKSETGSQAIIQSSGRLGSIVLIAYTMADVDRKARSVGLTGSMLWNHAPSSVYNYQAVRAGEGRTNVAGSILHEGFNRQRAMNDV